MIYAIGLLAEENAIRKVVSHPNKKGKYITSFRLNDKDKNLIIVSNAAPHPHMKKISQVVSENQVFLIPLF